MKKLFSFSLLTLVIVFSLFMLSCASSNLVIGEPAGYTNNPDLETIFKSETWQGTPLDSDGNFRNIYDPFVSNLIDFLRWQASTNPQKAEKKADTTRLNVIYDLSVLDNEEDKIIWLGHATFYIYLNGVGILLDPVLIDNFFLKRNSKLPFGIDDIKKVDYILVSHDHRDHCDESTLKILANKFPHAQFLAGLETDKLIKDWVKKSEVQGAGWYQKFKTNSNIEIVFVPARHWSKRGPFDENKRLWGGFYVKSPDKTIYFMGDSGNSKHFEDIANILGSPDYCIMGVGAYKPEWFMKRAHISPLDAIDAFNLMGGKYFIPMHFGTFDLSDEPLLEPLRVLEENSNKIKGKLVSSPLGTNLIQN